jgi:mRNA interferase RelE/StbE
VPAYTVLFLPTAEREWRKLPPEVRRRIAVLLLALEDEPRPDGVAKLRGTADRWRVRSGDYRVIFRVDDTTRTVTVLRIAHRREAYR